MVASNMKGSIMVPKIIHKKKYLLASCTPSVCSRAHCNRRYRWFCLRGVLYKRDIICSLWCKKTSTNWGRNHLYQLTNMMSIVMMKLYGTSATCGPGLYHYALISSFEIYSQIFELLDSRRSNDSKLASLFCCYTMRKSSVTKTDNSFPFKFQQFLKCRPQKRLLNT